MKFLKALQKDIGNNFSYLVPMNISQYLPEVEGDNLPQAKVSQTQPSCMLSILCYDKGNEKSLVFFNFLKALQEDTGNNSYISSL